MKYKVVSQSSPSRLSESINKYISEGWKPIGSHLVSIVHSQNRFSGTTHKDTIHETEYSQTIVMETPKNVIEVDISFFHPDDNENIKVYDEEGMLEEFDYKLKQVMNEK